MKTEATADQNILTAEHYFDNFSVCNFINAYYQIRDSLAYRPSSVLIVGVGLALEQIILREKFGVSVTTLDLDAKFNVDHAGSVTNMEMFGDKAFDVCIVSHVLEHLRFGDFEPALGEIARVANHALIYLPYGSRHLELKFIRAQHEKEYGIRCSIPRLKKIDGSTPELCGNEHYWECGYRNFEVRRIRSVIARHFTIDNMYHNHDWKYSINFCLTPKR